MYCNTNQFPALPFFSPHYKPNGKIGLSNHVHLRFDPKIGNVVCAIHRIPCAYLACKSMLDKTWISSIASHKQERYNLSPSARIGQY